MIGSRDQRGRLDAMNYFYVKIYVVLMKVYNPFLTEIEAGSMEKFLVNRFSVYENDAA